MRTIETNVYSFSELSEESKQKAIERLYDINVDCEWWSFIYDDANNIGLRITGFDIDRASYCKGVFLLSSCEVAANILKEHGENCETYKTAQKFLELHNPIFANYMDENHESYESAESENLMIEMENDFLNDLLEDYRILLSHEYDYLTSKESIIKTIEANEYEFTIDGKLI